MTNGVYESGMRQGNIIKEKKEYILERFQTKEGLVDFFVGTAIWSYIVINYTDLILNYFLGQTAGFAGIGMQAPFNLQYYASFMLYGVTMTIVGFVISYAINAVFRELSRRGNKK